MEWVRRHRGKVALGGGVLGGLYLLGRLAERQVVAARWVGWVCCVVVWCVVGWWCVVWCGRWCGGA